MVAPLLSAGASDDLVIATLKWQMHVDLAERDHAGIRELIEQWAPAMHQAGVEIWRRCAEAACTFERSARLV